MSGTWTAHRVVACAMRIWPVLILFLAHCEKPAPSPQPVPAEPVAVEPTPPPPPSPSEGGGQGAEPSIPAGGGGGDPGIGGGNGDDGAGAGHGTGQGTGAGTGGRRAYPACLQKAFDSYAAKRGKSDPPATITRWNYNGKTVWGIPAPCCDQFNVVVDDSCKTVCAPSGGITGRGDGKCPDFQSKATGETQVWPPGG